MRNGADIAVVYNVVDDRFIQLYPQASQAGFRWIVMGDCINDFKQNPCGRTIPHTIQNVDLGFEVQVVFTGGTVKGAFELGNNGTLQRYQVGAFGACINNICRQVNPNVVLFLRDSYHAA